MDRALRRACFNVPGSIEIVSAARPGWCPQRNPLQPAIGGELPRASTDGGLCSLPASPGDDVLSEAQILRNHRGELPTRT